jgi:uncharacterized membrane protein
MERIKLGQALQRYFVTGLAALFPVVVTLYLLVAIFKFSDGLLGRYLGSRIPGLGLLLTLLITLAVGFLSSRFIGRFLFPVLETWFSRLPLIRAIYPAVKQLTRFLFSDEKNVSIRRVAMVEYPRPGVFTLAFVTNETLTSVTGAEEKLLTLLIPTPPSPFSGPLIFVREKDVTFLDMPVEDALKLVVSGGVASAPLRAKPLTRP